MYNVGSDNQGKGHRLHLFKNIFQVLFKFRYDVRTLSEVMTALDNGLEHVIQAGIDRTNQVLFIN